MTSKPDFKVMVLLLVFMQLTRDLFAIAKFLLICVLVFVSRDFELGRVSVQFANAFAITIPFARWRRRSEELTVNPVRG